MVDGISIFRFRSPCDSPAADYFTGCPTASHADCPRQCVPQGGGRACPWVHASPGVRWFDERFHSDQLGAAVRRLSMWQIAKVRSARFKVWKWKSETHSATRIQHGAPDDSPFIITCEHVVIA